MATIILLMIFLKIFFYCRTVPYVLSPASRAARTSQSMSAVRTKLAANDIWKMAASDAVVINLDLEDSMPLRDKDVARRNIITAPPELELGKKRCQQESMGWKRPVGTTLFWICWRKAVQGLIRS